MELSLFFISWLHALERNKFTRKSDENACWRINRNQGLKGHALEATRLRRRGSISSSITGVSHLRIMYLYKLKQGEAMLTCNIGARIKISSHLHTSATEALWKQKREKLCQLSFENLDWIKILVEMGYSHNVMDQISWSVHTEDFSLALRVFHEQKRWDAMVTYQTE